ncbi:MAG: class I SAM-dependent methyltransferase [Bacteroidales bacterium]|jgi:23S rRNA (cytosine1962-C5)-methyltransferase|nr:class I SAM-dependent methyltransferase [Bacteroidales bacterium]
MKLNIHDIWPEYELIDSGAGKKLERFGKLILIRPEASANHKPAMGRSEWQRTANAEFVQSGSTSGKWETLSAHPDEWILQLPESLKNLKIKLKKTGFKHVGVFPEQILNWNFIAEKAVPTNGSMLNLFGYTGVSSLVGAAFGYQVCHVDALKQLVQWGKSMMQENSLENIRWICDDAPSFVQREIRRGNLYDLILADPPAFGYGKAKRPWKIERDLLSFIQNVSQILRPNGVFSLSIYTQSLEKDVVIEMCKDCGLKMVNSNDMLGLDRYSKCIDHGKILYFSKEG